MHELLLNMNKFKDVIHALDFIGENRDTSAIESFNVVLKHFQGLESLIRKTKDNFLNFENTFYSLKKINMYDERIDNQDHYAKDEGLNSESFMFKHILESVIWESELWSDLSKQINLEKEGLEDLKVAQGEFEKMKDLKGIHNYLNKLTFKNLFYANKRRKDIDKNDIKMHFMNYISEIEGITNRLEFLLKDWLAKYNNNISQKLSIDSDDPRDYRVI